MTSTSNVSYASWDARFARSLADRYESESEPQYEYPISQWKHEVTAELMFPVAMRCVPDM